MRESLLVVASCTKAAMVTSVLMLADAGAIHLDAPVAAYWPEFGQAAKRDIRSDGCSDVGPRCPTRTQKQPVGA
jgi:hypothetical protein